MFNIIYLPCKKYRSSKSKRRQAELLDLFFETVISCMYNQHTSAHLATAHTSDLTQQSPTVHYTSVFIVWYC